MRYVSAKISSSHELMLKYAHSASEASEKRFHIGWGGRFGIFKIWDVGEILRNLGVGTFVYAIKPMGYEKTTVRGRMTKKNCIFEFYVKKSIL